jgi:hypothetical protein
VGAPLAYNLSSVVACLFLDLSVTLGFFVKGMTQQIDWDIIQVDIFGAHTMFLYRMFGTTFQNSSFVLPFITKSQSRPDPRHTKTYITNTKDGSILNFFGRI